MSGAAEVVLEEEVEDRLGGGRNGFQGGILTHIGKIRNCLP